MNKFAPIKGATSTVEVKSVGKIQAGDYGEYRIVDVVVNKTPFAWLVSEKMWDRANGLIVPDAILSVSCTDKGYVTIEKYNALKEATQEKAREVEPQSANHESQQSDSDKFHPSRRNMLLSYWKDMVIAGKLNLNDTDWLRKMDDFVEKGVVPSGESVPVDGKTMMEGDSGDPLSVATGTLLGCPPTTAEVDEFISTIRSVAKCNKAHGDKAFDYVTSKLGQLFDCYMGKAMSCVFTLTTRDADGFEKLIGGQDRAFIRWATLELEKEMK